MADNPLNQDPSNYANLGDMLSKVLQNAFMKSENMLPARVVSYDRAKNVAVVAPLIKIILTGEKLSRPEIGPVPVFAFGAGNFVVNFPIKAGDIGWILANDRDTTNFLDTLEESEPKTYRLHDFNDSVFFPDVIRDFNTSGEDGCMVIQNKDGTVRISLGEGRIKLTHPTEVLVEAPMTRMSQDCEILGKLHVVGDITNDGTTTASVDVVGGGIPLKSHKHSGVQTGSGQTAGPVA